MTFGVQSLSSIKKIGGLKGRDPKWQKGLLLLFFKRGEKDGRREKKYRTQSKCFKQIFDE